MRWRARRGAASDRSADQAPGDLFDGYRSGRERLLRVGRMRATIGETRWTLRSEMLSQAQPFEQGNRSAARIWSRLPETTRAGCHEAAHDVGVAVTAEIEHRHFAVETGVVASQT